MQQTQRHLRSCIHAAAAQWFTNPSMWCQAEQSLQQRMKDADARAAEVQQQLSDARQELSDAQQQLAAAAQAGDASATMQVTRFMFGC
jgi:chromosome segregation ATPase